MLREPLSFASEESARAWGARADRGEYTGARVQHAMERFLLSSLAEKWMSSPGKILKATEHLRFLRAAIESYEKAHP